MVYELHSKKNNKGFLPQKLNKNKTIAHVAKILTIFSSVESVLLM